MRKGNTEMLTPNIHFRGNCYEAIQVYKDVFDLEVKILEKNKDANPSDYIADEKHTDHVYHAEVLLSGDRIIMSDILDDEHIPGHSVSLVVTFESAPEVKKSYGMLEDGATIIHELQTTTYSSCFVSLIDRFGIRWELMTEQTER